jgi:hypothetical protein
MARKLFILFVVIALACPLVFGIGLLLSIFMPNCTWAASAPAGGCFLLGLNLNWFITLSTVAFVGSFIAVPIGIVGAVISQHFIPSQGKARFTPSK